MVVLAYIVAVLAIVSWIALAIERLAVTSAAEVLRAAAEMTEPPQPAPVVLDIGGGGTLSPLYPATPGKELLAARTRQLANGTPAYGPAERRLVAHRKPEPRLAASDDRRATTGAASEPTPAPVFLREIAY